MQVGERVANRTKAAAHVARELFRGKRNDRVQQSIASPVVVVDERLHFGGCHASSLSLAVLGKKRSKLQLPHPSVDCWELAVGKCELVSIRMLLSLDAAD